ncbi:MAG: hypothetical protein A3F31_04060 [Candidatus Levybacteria bacterium RIFCSPHIGHO2_12_FULL_38_12]|nr:MAG: hypothetical protein A3F31_04060 [Candidatus Levybacteria bacterium RIFCSPHIGHO2_12_FULL_38_12]OGH44443.1 MAG: hypothetical protein A3J14_03255 [Candidatus Levybacteria bacterium RIFCSPLOWO2_02_FULL_37_18]
MEKQSKNKTTGLATKNDLKKVEKSLRVELQKVEKSLRVELLRLEERIENSDENAIEYRDQILTKLDKVMGELQTMREENTVGAYQIRELREKVDGHELRITRLEN